MALRSNETLEAFVDKLSRNNEIMNIMNLPTVLDTDADDIIKQKRKKAIDKVIVKSAQEPTELGKKFAPVIFDNFTYSDFGKIRLNIALTQSIKLNNDVFGNPQVDINVYYDNTNMKNIFRLFDLISDEFSGKNLVVKTAEGKQTIRNLRCEGITSQVAMVNNYERVGIRFSFFATLYKI